MFERLAQAKQRHVSTLAREHQLVPAYAPHVTAVYGQDNSTGLFAGSWLKPSDGLEPSTPSLPSSNDAGTAGTAGNSRARKPRKKQETAKDE